MAADKTRASLRFSCVIFRIFSYLLAFFYFLCFHYSIFLSFFNANVVKSQFLLHIYDILFFFCALFLNTPQYPPICLVKLNLVFSKKSLLQAGATNALRNVWRFWTMTRDSLPWKAAVQTQCSTRPLSRICYTNILFPEPL